MNEKRKALSHLDLANAGGYKPMSVRTIHPNQPHNGGKVAPLSLISYNQIPPSHPLQPLILCLRIQLYRMLHMRPSLLLGQGRRVFTIVMMGLRVRATPAENWPIMYLALQNHYWSLHFTE